MPACPRCESESYKKNGKIHNGKQRYQCLECDRQYVEDPQQREVSDETKDLVDKLLLERLSLAGIGRVLGLSERWLQSYVNKKISRSEAGFC